MKSQRNKKAITISHLDSSEPKLEENSLKKINYKNYFV